MISLPITLPLNSKCLISVGDKVSQGQVVAEKKSSQVGKILPLAKYLGVSPKSTIKYLKKQMGDRIEKGELLAQKKELLKQKKLLSPFSGTVFKLEEDTGDLYIITEEGEGEGQSIFSPVDGKVVFCDNSKIVLETDKNAVSSQKALGEKNQGELFLIEGEEIDYDKISDKVAKKVILGKKFDKAAIYKAMAMEAIGIICQEIEDKDFNELGEGKIKNPICQVSLEDFEKLVKEKDRIVFLEPDKNLIIL